MLKKFGKRFVTAFLALAVVFAVSLVGLASEVVSNTAPAVILTEQDGQAKFVSTYNGDTNLFPNFQAVMPGDKLTQSMTVKADNSNGYRYNIYLFALICETSNEEHPTDTLLRKEGFLDYLTLSVTRDDNNGAVGGAQFGKGTGAEGVLLGAFSAGSTLDLTVELAVDIQMGNDFQGAKEYIDWVFYAQQIEDPFVPPTEGPTDPPTGPTDPTTTQPPASTRPPATTEEETIVVDTPTTELPPPTEEEVITDGTPLGDLPETGFQSNIPFWAIMSAISGFALLAVVLIGRQHKKAS